jgi:DNA polymerase (family 10)
MLGRRGPCALDLPRLVAGAAERKVALEINAQPKRLDLDGDHLRQVREAGGHVTIGTDAHWTAHLDNLRLGVDQARRGWLERRHVLNTRSLGHLRRMLRR